MRIPPFILGTAMTLFLAGNGSASMLYVDLNSTNPTQPYTNWSTAATNIQDAVDASHPGDTVLVTNGIYAAGGRMWYDSGSNRVTLTNAVTLRSVNGPRVTVIVGNRIAGIGQVLSNAARCVGMGNGAVLSGFTLTNGESGWGNYPDGGGVANILSGTSTVTNCVLVGNLSTNGAGGGAYSVRLINCKITGNYGEEGGGACGCTLINCMVTSNTAANGGGVYGSITYGMSFLTNCTVVGNSATNAGGGVYGSTVYNGIVYYNSAAVSNNFYGGTLNYSCTYPVPPSGANNITNEPSFVDLVIPNLRLQSNSPCINAGNNLYVSGTTDLDGRPRIVGAKVDVGAFEFQKPGMGEFLGWLEQYGLPTDGSVDYADLDGTGFNVYQDWIAGLNPTNAASVLAMQIPVVNTNSTGLTVSWLSVSNRTYYLQRATNLAASPAFSTIQSNIAGQVGTTSFQDATATNGGPYFYRVGVQ